MTTKIKAPMQGEAIAGAIEVWVDVSTYSRLDSREFVCLWKHQKDASSEVNMFLISPAELEAYVTERERKAFEAGAELERAKILEQLKAKFSGTMFEANVMSRVKDILEGR